MHMMYQYYNMAWRLSGPSSIFGIEGQKELNKIALNYVLKTSEPF